jgi:osmoprotectant transport system ATP-binding protein
MSAEIVFDKARLVYPGQSTAAVDELTLTVPAGQVCVLVGPSGSGKTTALTLVNRLVELTSGDIRLDGVSIRSMDVIELRRRIGYVIQQAGLFPHLTVADNIATVPRVLGWSKQRISERTKELLELVGLADEAKRYPAQLSGGQQQRVGIARALAADPPLMLMDEPFGALDPITRERVQDEFVRLNESLGKTTVFVTHDIDEALKMGDHIAILRDGRLVQHGPPDDILASPADDFVARFVGADRALKRLALTRLSELALEPVNGQVDGLPSASGETSVRTGLSLLLASGADRLVVTGEKHGIATLKAIRELSA